MLLSLLNWRWSIIPSSPFLDILCIFLPFCSHFSYFSSEPTSSFPRQRPSNPQPPQPHRRRGTSPLTILAQWEKSSKPCLDDLVVLVSPTFLMYQYFSGNAQPTPTSPTTSSSRHVPLDYSRLVAAHHWKREARPVPAW